MKLRTENLIASIRIMPAAYAFLITLLVGILVNTDPLKLLITAIIVYVFFLVFGGIFAKMLSRVNYEITDIDRDKVDEEAEKKKGAVGRLLDIRQSAEGPFKK